MNGTRGYVRFYVRFGIIKFFWYCTAIIYTYIFRECMRLHVYATTRKLAFVIINVILVRIHF